MDSKFLYNHKTLKERRRDLRNNQTEAEKLLWQHISRDKICGLRFLRQYSVGPYILDFYCAKLRLGIEVDGEVHNKEERKLYDKDREKFLKNLNIEIIRFWNSDVLKNIEDVKMKIRNFSKNKME